jgi:hypothetical protein
MVERGCDGKLEMDLRLMCDTKYPSYERIVVVDLMQQNGTQILLIMCSTKEMLLKLSKSQSKCHIMKIHQYDSSTRMGNT